MELGERYELKEEAYFTQAQAFPSWVTVKLGKGLVQVINCPHWDKEIGILPLKQDFFFFFRQEEQERNLPGDSKWDSSSLQGGARPSALVLQARSLQPYAGDSFLVPLFFPPGQPWSVSIPFYVRKLFLFYSDPWDHLVDFSYAIFLTFFHSAHSFLPVQEE